jgi:hypothetical protein
MRARFLLASAAFAALSTISTNALAQGATGSVCTDGSTSTATGRGACSGHGGVDAKATAAAHKASTSASTVACTDGSTSKGGRGACSGHGGIATASSTHAAPAPAPAPAPVPAPAPPPPSASRTSTTTTATSHSNATGGSGKSENNDPTGATAKCKDGMYSHSAHKTGTCSGHGGVAQWLTT